MEQKPIFYAGSKLSEPIARLLSFDRFSFNIFLSPISDAIHDVNIVLDAHIIGDREV